MGRKRTSPNEKTLKILESEIQSATMDVRHAIVRLVQAKAVLERFTGQATIEKSCNCILEEIQRLREKTGENEAKIQNV